MIAPGPTNDAIEASSPPLLEMPTAAAWTLANQGQLHPDKDHQQNTDPVDIEEALAARLTVRCEIGMGGRQ